MYWYSLLFIIILLALYYGGIVDKKIYEKRFLFICFFVLFMYMSLRASTVGVDTESYCQIFLRVAHLDFKYILNLDFNSQLNIEVGYLLYNKILSLFFENKQWITVFNSLIINIGMYNFLKKNCSNTFLGIYVYLGCGLFTFSFNITRQMIAVVLCLNAYLYLKEKKYLKSIILSILAFTFHQTAIVFILCLFFTIIKKSKKNCWFFIILSIIISILYDQLLLLIVKVIPRFAGYLSITIAQDEIGNIRYLMLVEIILSILSIQFFHWKNKEQEEKMRIASVMTILYILLTIMGVRSNFMDRIGYYFLPFVIVLFSDFIGVIPKKFRSLYNIGIASIMLFYLVIQIIIGGQGSLEYSFFWSI